MEGIRLASKGLPWLSPQHDAVGNRTYSTVNGVQTAYSYDANDRLIQQGGETYSYDDNGNTLSKTIDAETSSYSYDAKNHMAGASLVENGITTNASYEYDIDGIRISKTEDGNSIECLVDENRDYAQVLRETDQGAGSSLDYLYGDDLIGQSQDSANEKYYLYDGLGSTRALTDPSGVTTDTYDYEAFGLTLNQTGTSENNYLFTGEQYDQTLNQQYLRARYYDPHTARFTQMDSWMGNSRDSITLHKYLYANVDPVNFIDPSGNISIHSLITTLNTQAIQAVAATQAGFAVSRAVGGAAINSLGLVIETGVARILTHSAIAHRTHIALVGEGGRRVVDFWLQMGNRIAALEVKYQLPRRGGEALTRLVNQIRTYSTAEEALRNNAQVVLFTFRAPSNAQMALLNRSLGAEAPFVQHVHGFTGLVQWIRFFFTATP